LALPHLDARRDTYWHALYGYRSHRRRQMN